MRRVIAQSLFLLLLATLPAGWTALAHPRRPVWDGEWSVSLRTARSWGRDVLWIDARPPEQYLLDRIPGAMPLNLQSWDQLLPFVRQAAEEKHLVVYGGDLQSDDAPMVARKLRQELRRDDVHFLRGGFAAWNEAMR